MSTRLNRALAEGERHSPDPTEVLAGIRAGVRRSHHRRRFAAAGAAGTIGVALVGGLLAGQLAFGPAPEAMAPGSAARPVTPVPAQACRLSFEWLPTGLSTPPIRTCGPGAQGVLYPMAGGPYLRVDLAAAGWQPPLERTGWDPVVVNGRAGRMAVRDSRALLLFPLPSGRWVDVEYGGPRAALRETAKRIAGGIGETVADTVRVPFTPTYLPRGQYLVALQSGTASGLTYRDGSGRVLDRQPAQGITEDGVNTDEPVIDHGIEYSIRWEPAGLGPSAMGFGKRSDRAVQGLPTYVLNRGLLMIVDDFHGGRLTLSSNATMSVPPSAPTAEPTNKAVPLRPSSPPEADRELRRIAEGIRWTG
ncbi:hypothetical protein [Micromonospora rubida]